MEMIPFRDRLEDDSMRQASLIEALIDPRLGSNERLSKIDALIDWSPIEAIVRKLRTGAQGRPPYAALKMVKALYLQALYDLSDPGLEEALLDRLSFRRFCGLALDEATPDETTILRFRHDAAEAQTHAGLLCGDQPAAGSQGSDAEEGHADGCDLGCGHSQSAEDRGRAWSNAPARAGSELDEEERPLAFRLQGPYWHGPALRSGPPSGADRRQDL